MAVLGVFTNVSTLSIVANSYGCLAHGLTTTPDLALYQGCSTFGAIVGMVSRTATAVIYFNTGGSTVAGECVAQVVHEIMR